MKLLIEFKTKMKNVDFIVQQNFHLDCCTSFSYLSHLDLSLKSKLFNLVLYDPKAELRADVAALRFPFDATLWQL